MGTYETANYMGVSIPKLHRIAREHGLQTYRDPADDRLRLYDVNEIEAIMRDPKPE